MSGREALCSVFAGLFVLAAIPACDGLDPGDYEVYRFGTAATIIAYAVPDYDASQTDKDAHAGAIPFNMYLFVDPTPEGSADDTSDPVVTTFGFVSDGLCFSEEYVEGDDPPGNTYHTVERGSGDDVSFVYASWIQLPQTDPADEVDCRVWYNQFPLSSGAVDRLTTGPPDTDDFFLFFEETGYNSSNTSVDDDQDLIVSTLNLDGLDEASSEIDLFANSGLVVWDVDTEADPKYFYVPLAMLSSITFTDKILSAEPIVSPGGDIIFDLPPDEDRLDSFNGTSEEPLTSGDRIFLVEPDALTDAIQGALIGPEVEFADPESAYTCQAVDPDGDRLMYRWVVYAVPWETEDPGRVLVAPGIFGGVDAPPPDTAAGPPPRMYSDFPDIPLATADEAQTGFTVISATVFVANGYTDLSVVNDVLLPIYNIPVPGDLLFDPPEPHIVELPYTFWVTIGPIELPPEDSMPETEPHELRVVVAPAAGGTVAVTTPTGTEEPDFPTEGDSNSVAFDYLIDVETDVTLTAVPTEGYRFVAWDSEDFHVDIPDPYSSALTLEIKPPMVYSNNPRKTTIIAHFAPYTGEPAEDAFPELGMGAIIKPVSHTIEDESGCDSIVEIGYDAIDLTDGQKPIEYVRLDIDGDELTAWSGTPTDRYHDDVTVESECSEVLTIALTGTNSEDQTMVATKVATIPPLSTHFDYSFEDGPEGGTCKKQLVIDLEATDLTVPDNPITHVVVKGNTSTWHDSGAISTDSYEHSFSGLVTCGGTYAVAVKATDADGNTHTYRETIVVPDEEPEEDEGPPPPATTTLYGAMAASASCTSAGGECSCQLTVSIDAEDLTGGTYPVTSVVLTVNGQAWHDSGGLSTTDYHQVVTKTVSCGASFNLELTAENSIGQTGSTTGSLTTPIP